MFDASRRLVLLRLRHPHVRDAAQQDHHSDPRLPARLLHGRARLADRVRGHAVRVREAAGQDRPRVRRAPKTTEGDRAMATQTRRSTAAFHQEPRPDVRHRTPAASSPSSSCSRSSSRSASRTRSSAICSCSSRWRSTPSSAWRRGRRRSPNTTSPAGACRPSTTAWRPAPTGCRRPRSSAWPARCSCSAMTAWPGCSAGPAASCWCRSWSDRTCASSAPIPCPTSCRSGSAATSPASSP